MKWNAMVPLLLPQNISFYLFLYFCLREQLYFRFFFKLKWPNGSDISACWVKSLKESCLSIRVHFSLPVPGRELRWWWARFDYLGRQYLRGGQCSGRAGSRVLGWPHWSEHLSTVKWPWERQISFIVPISVFLDLFVIVVGLYFTMLFISL